MSLWFDLCQGVEEVGEKGQGWESIKLDCYDRTIVFSLLPLTAF
jgi:hypothetical protein